MTLHVFTAFSGYDSQCMALDRLHRHNPDFNYELVGWAEIDKHAIAAHNAVYPQWADRNYGDISKIDWSQVPDFDLFTYSSPCQDFSQAGKQAGGTEGSGTRSSLLWECRRAILAKKPKYLLMENVAALVSQKFIRLFNAWQLELERYGYRNFAKVLNAKDYGVPQNRERIFMVSVLDEQARYEFPDPMPLQLRLKDVLEPKVDERYYISDSLIETFNKHAERQGGIGKGFAWNPTDGNCVGHCLEAKSQPRPKDNWIIIPTATKDGVQEMELGGVADLSYPNSKTRRGRVQEGGTVAPTLTCGCEGALRRFEPFIVAQRGREPQVMTPKRTEYGKQIRKQYESHEVQEPRKNIQQLEPRTDGVSNTLTGVQKDNYFVEPIRRKDQIRYKQMENGNIRAYRDDDKKSGVSELQIMSPENVACTVTTAHEPKVIETTYRIRKLTERECFRLMDVPEEYIDRIQAAGISRSQQYKMAGNSIVVACMYHLFRKLWIDTQIKTLTLF